MFLKGTLLLLPTPSGSGSLIPKVIFSCRQAQFLREAGTRAGTLFLDVCFISTTLYPAAHSPQVTSSPKFLGFSLPAGAARRWRTFPPSLGLGVCFGASCGRGARLCSHQRHPHAASTRSPAPTYRIHFIARSHVSLWCMCVYVYPCGPYSTFQSFTQTVASLERLFHLVWKCLWRILN